MNASVPLYQKQKIYNILLKFSPHERAITINTAFPAGFRFPYFVVMFGFIYSKFQIANGNSDPFLKIEMGLHRNGDINI